MLKIVIRLKNLFTPTESIKKSKEKWNSLARKNAQYYIWTEKEKFTDDEFRKSGIRDYKTYIKNDELLNQKLQKIHAKTALEIGCGVGRVTEYFKDDFEKIYGIDISEEMIQRAKKRLPHEQFTFIANNGSHLPLENETIDFIFSYIVFQHIPSYKIIKEYMNEIYRVLKPGGIFKVQVRGLEVDKKKWYYGVHFNEQKIKKILDKTKLKMLRIKREEKKLIWLLLEKIN